MKNKCWIYDRIKYATMYVCNSTASTAMCLPRHCPCSRRCVAIGYIYTVSWSWGAGGLARFIVSVNLHCTLSWRTGVYFYYYGQMYTVSWSWGAWGWRLFLEHKHIYMCGKARLSKVSSWSSGKDVCFRSIRSWVRFPPGSLFSRLSLCFKVNKNNGIYSYRFRFDLHGLA